MSNYNFTPEQLKAAKTAKSPEELTAMAKERGVEITPEQAAAFLNPPAETMGELSDDELENVAGGYCKDGRGREVITLMTTCLHGLRSKPNKLRKVTCGNETDGESAFNQPDLTSETGSIKHIMNIAGTGKTDCQYVSYEKGRWYCNYNVMPH